VLCEGKDSPAIGTSNDFEVNLHDVRYALEPFAKVRRCHQIVGGGAWNALILSKLQLGVWTLNTQEPFQWFTRSAIESERQ